MLCNVLHMQPISIMLDLQRCTNFYTAAWQGRCLG